MSENFGERVVGVWDVPTRVFHWLVVVLVGAAYATVRLNWMDWHARAGYALLAALLFRLTWGVVGSETARFSALLTAPRHALGHIARLFRREPDRQLGHNAAGGWMVVALLALLAGQALSGVYVGNDIADEGPLTESVPAWLANIVEAAHDQWLWNALLTAITFHIIAIALYAAVKGQNLVRPMVTGVKRLPIGTRAPTMRSPALAAIILACSVAVAAAVVRFL